MPLAVEGVEERVESRGDVPPPLEVGEVELRILRFWRRDRIGVLVDPLRDALLLRDRAGVEGLDGRVGVEVPAPDLAGRLVGAARAFI